MVQPLVSGEREILVFETVQHRKDGSAYPVEVHLQLVSAAGGVVFLAIINDITARKRAEEEQTKLASLVEMSRDFIGIASLEGKVTYLNNAALALVGLANLQEARGRSIFEFYAESHLLQAREEMIVSVQKEGYWYGETRFKHFRTGDPIDVEMAGFKIRDERGAPIYLATISRDITKRKWAEEERRKLEQQLQTTQKLESLGILAAGIAHEIRNPLSGINISLSSIEHVCRHSSGLEPEKMEKIRLLMDHMNAAATKIASIVQRVMDFSKPSPPRMAMADLNEVIAGAIRMTSSTLRKRGTAIHADLAPDLPACRVDSGMIEQVLVNLLTNAYQAMERIEGEKHLEISSVVQDGQIVIRVSDSGPGVPPSIRGKIFDPFFTTRKDGSGIGLSFSHRIIAAHGGTLRVNTSRWGGAEFRIELPTGAREGIPA
jgi:PAS domain S-box-containing protein